MNVIRPNCRAQFTASDMDFILAAMGEKPQSIDTLLDEPDLFHAVLSKPACIQVSAQFYFYVLVRHVLRDAGVDDRDVADYVAEVLAEFARTERSRAEHTMVQLLAFLHEQDRAGRFVVQAHIGNLSLFLCGLFPAHLRRQVERRAAPDVQYYENMGRLSFRAAGDNPLAQRYDLGPIFHRLSTAFHETRMALNDLSDRLVFLDQET